MGEWGGADFVSSFYESEIGSSDLVTESLSKCTSNLSEISESSEHCRVVLDTSYLSDK